MSTAFFFLGGTHIFTLIRYSQKSDFYQCFSPSASVKEATF